MITKERQQAGHIEKFTITRSERGWNVREEHDRQVVHSATYTDWHRVERAMDAFDRADHSLYSTNR